MCVVILSKSLVLCQHLRIYKRESGEDGRVDRNTGSTRDKNQAPAYMKLHPSRENTFLIGNKNGSICKGERKYESI